MYIRELLLAQSSDWAFLMHSEPQQWYAKTRVETHLRNLHAIQEAIETNSGAINLLEERDNGTWLFGDLDLVAEYQSILHA
jgi:1,4-alpha-glucan branching enzyme